MRMFNINRQLKKEATVATKLSWVQRLVCRIFKLTPLILYRYKITLELEQDFRAGGGRIADIVNFLDGSSWIVTYAAANIVELQNTKPLLIDRLTGTFVIMASTYAEGGN